MEAKEVAVARTRDQLTAELTAEVVEIVHGAVDALMTGRSTADVRSQLREMSRRITELEFEFKGGCRW
jgi:hypothetical protein